MKYLLPASYTTAYEGFVKTTVDAPCPTEVGDSNWIDAWGSAFNPPGIIVRACPENIGSEATHSLFNQLSLNLQGDV